MTLQQQAALLSLSRSSLYYRPGPPSAEEIAIKHRLDELYTQFPYFGSRKMTVMLRPTWSINRKRVQRYMREMGLAAIFPGPRTSQPAPGHKIYPYLLRQIKASYPNHIWGIDIEANHGLSRSQAYCLCSAAADLKISQIVDAPNWIVSCYMPLSILKK